MMRARAPGRDQRSVRSPRRCRRCCKKAWRRGAHLRTCHREPSPARPDVAREATSAASSRKVRRTPEKWRFQDVVADHRHQCRRALDRTSTAGCAVELRKHPQGGRAPSAWSAMSIRVLARETRKGDGDWPMQAKSELVEANLPPRGEHCQEVHQPWASVPRPHPGRQHRPDEGRGEVRVPPRATSSRPTPPGGSGRPSPAPSPTRPAPSASRCT